MTCFGTTSVGGASVSAATGVTLPGGLGVAVLGRAFNQLSFESWLKSRYAVALAQYSPPALEILTLNAGAGWGRHSSEPNDASANGGGAILYSGVALRLPPKGSVALSVTADLIQSVSGAPRPHPRLVSFGVAIGAASAARSLASP